jgi:transcription termination factor Rho
MESEQQRSDLVSEQPETEVEKPKPRARAPRKRVTKAEEASVAVVEPSAAVETQEQRVTEPPQPEATPAQQEVTAESTQQPEAPSGSVEEAPEETDRAPAGQSQQRQGRPHRDRQDRRSGDSQANGAGGSIEQTRPHDQRGFRGRQQRDRDRDRQADSTQRDGPTLNIIELDQKELPELQEMARELEVPNFQRYRKSDLIIRILQAQTEAQGFKYGEGVLDVIEDGFGFLRGERYLPGPDDIYVSQSQIRRFGLRTGDKVSGQIRPPKDNEKFHSLLRVEAVNGLDPETARRRPNFDTLTPIFPLELIDLETLPHVISTRLLNLVAPIGRGQRGLIVSPPKAGKTLILKAIANGVTTNYSDIHLMVCLIGERPEEVTDMKRSVDGEVISSTFDEPVEDHTKVAEMALDRAKRLVEGGRDVVILLDSITRLARAYNLAVPPSGRTLSGGIDPIALYPPKRFFGAARNIEGGGSLTIVATCLVDTGSRMDDVIYEEFKGTGNMELHLDRKLAERRIYPAIDIQRSGTRREDLLLDENTLRQVYTMRRMVSMLGGSEGTELLLGRLAKTSNNPEFLLTLTKDM